MHVASRDQRLTISACMVIRNAEPILARCLARIAAYFDEIIIADRESTDRSRAVAREYGANVFPIIPTLSLAELRDVCAGQSSCDWLVWLEPSKLLAEEDTIAIRTALAKAGNDQLTFTTSCGPIECWRRSVPKEMPSIDVIILSYSKTKKEYEMTRRCLESLRQSEREIDFNVVVVETNTGEAMRDYSTGKLFDDPCQVVFPHKPFNYNEFLQFGFRQLEGSKSEYLLIANNDVLFEPGFATVLLDGLTMSFPSVSPWCPGYHERFFDPNVPYHPGLRTSLEVCGWALMFRKEILRQISFVELFPTDFAFWFQDNYYAHQLQQHGLAHALVTNARVKHLFEQSHGLIDNDRRQLMTQGMIDAFRRKTEPPLSRDTTLLTIAIPTVPARVRTHLPRLIEKLTKQAEGKPVEVLALLDNKVSSLGVKRNALMDMVQGRFLAFVDDDDDVADDYVDALLQQIETNPDVDCIVYDAWVTISGHNGRVCRYGMQYQDVNLPEAYYRQPNHVCCFRTEIARKAHHEDMTQGEDSRWAAAVRRHLKSQAYIDAALYYYRADPATSQCIPAPGTNGRVTAADQVTLTVAVLSVPARVQRMLPPLVEKLQRQAEGKPVEILVLLDNKRRTIGAKRNALVRLAKGNFISFVDDDDDIVDDYVASLFTEIEGHPAADCIVFDAWVTQDDQNGKACRYGIEFTDHDTADLYFRQPNHICCLRTGLARQVPFPDVNWHEDFHWAAAIRPHIRSQARVPRILYQYRYRSSISETREARDIVAPPTSTASIGAIHAQSVREPVEEGPLSPVATDLPIYGFMHVATKNHWRQIVNEQLVKIRESGLYKKTEQIFVGVVGPHAQELQVSDPKVQVIYRSPHVEEAEFPTLEYLQKFCRQQECLVYYIHTKGVFRASETTHDWRLLMEHFILLQHEDCARRLEMNDVCGVNWITDSIYPHFSGNFWWARSDYIRSLPDVRSLPADSRLGNEHRHACERWIGCRPGVRAASLHQSNVNHYHQRYPSSRYTEAPTHEFLQRTTIDDMSSATPNDEAQQLHVESSGFPPRCKNGRIHSALAIVTYVPQDCDSRLGMRLPTAIESLQASGYPGPVIVVDDGSADPSHHRYLDSLGSSGQYEVVRRPRNGGVSRAKNTCIAKLLDLGVEVGFIAEDDIEFRAGWHDAYFSAHQSTGIAHFSWSTDDDPLAASRVTHVVKGHAIVKTSHLNGVLLTFTPQVVREVGGFKILPERWGYTHVNWTSRIVKAGLAPFWADIEGSNRYITQNRYSQVSAVSTSEKARATTSNLAAAMDVSELFCPIEQ